MKHNVRSCLFYVHTALLGMLLSNTTVLLAKKDAVLPFVKHAKGVHLSLGGRLADEFFVYNHARTLRGDLHDFNDFFRHRLDFDLAIEHGNPKCPMSQAFVRFTNYVYWQQHDQYLPAYTATLDPRRDTPSLSSRTNTSNLTPPDAPVRHLLPIIFVEQAWWQLDLNQIAPRIPYGSYFKAGYFPYQVGRGVSMGYHNDLGVDYLGLPGDGHFTRYPTMPPGVLLHMQINDCTALEAYYMQWRETNAGISDTLAHTRAPLLASENPERGSSKDRYNIAVRLQNECCIDDWGTLQTEPYWVFTRAPEQSLEFTADASANLHTIGCMVNYESDRVSFNVEIAGQFGHQNVYAIDRNQGTLEISGDSGLVENKLSHVRLQNKNGIGALSPSSNTSGTITPINFDCFRPQSNLGFIADLPKNREPNATQLFQENGKNPAEVTIGNQSVATFNSQRFGDKRFRPGYKLSHQGFMLMADLAYHCACVPMTVGAAAGFIGGSAYPYNDESSRTTRHFVPMRSRYTGMHVKNILFFDRLIIPRPLNVSNRTLYAFNNLKDLNNLQFLGVSCSWYPCEKQETCSIRADLMALWEVGRLYRWDINGQHPDKNIEAQLAGHGTKNCNDGLRARYDFQGWESCKNASRMLGTELDVQVDYQLMAHCTLMARGAVFFTGRLYKHLIGQPNDFTRRIDREGLDHYESLGDKTAFAFIVGCSYTF